jgi:hypothetical protein
MGVKVLRGVDEPDGTLGRACLFCTTSNYAFGPLFRDWEEGAEFLDWMKYVRVSDPRKLTGDELSSEIMAYRNEAAVKVTCAGCSGNGIEFEDTDEGHSYVTTCPDCDGDKTTSRAFQRISEEYV